MKDKKELYIAVAIVLAALVIAFQPGEAATLTVSGDGEVFAAPDTAEFSFYVNALAPTVDEAKSLVDSQQQEITAGLLLNGVPKENIQTQSYSIDKEERWDKESDTYIFVGWRVRTSISVKTKNIGSVGSLIDVVAENGGEMYGSIRFYIEDDEELREASMAEAIAEAKSKAESAAKEAGVRLVRIKSIAPSYNNYPIYRGYAEFAAAGAAIEPGEEEVSASVTIVYEVA